MKFWKKLIYVNAALGSILPFSYVRFNAAEYIFLRYSCSTTESFARMYTLDGTLESECVSRNGVSECGFGGNAFYGLYLCRYDSSSVEL